ncbi:UNKNOWN [Stylonychia lemnae]|uniref:Uncharacterized protein n=1 Tax=Stylonychia lemnae TaxID=5949 RepID=A0A078A136_STYLE|nr:UNKNOWN [Stylonychia lemnae]|eukprot:CDW75946.1 UNKNOWN [Stylonychia lemnae]
MDPFANMKSIPTQSLNGESVQFDQQLQLKSARDERTPKLRPVVLKRKTPRPNHEDESVISRNDSNNQSQSLNIQTFSMLYSERKQSVQNLPNLQQNLQHNKSYKDTSLALDLSLLKLKGSPSQKYLHSSVLQVYPSDSPITRTFASPPEYEEMRQGQGINYQDQNGIRHHIIINQSATDSKQQQKFRLSKIIEQYNKQRTNNNVIDNKINMARSINEEDSLIGKSDTIQHNQQQFQLSHTPIRKTFVTRKQSLPPLPTFQQNLKQQSKTIEMHSGENTPKNYNNNIKQYQIKQIDIHNTIQSKTINNDSPSTSININVQQQHDKIFIEAQNAYKDYHNQPQKINESQTSQKKEDGQGFDFSFSQLNTNSANESIVKATSKTPNQPRSRKQKFIDKQKQQQQIHQQSHQQNQISNENELANAKIYFRNQGNNNININPVISNDLVRTIESQNSGIIKQTNAEGKIQIRIPTQQLRTSKNRNNNVYLKQFLTPNKSNLEEVNNNQGDQNQFSVLNIENLENIQLRLSKQITQTDRPSSTYKQSQSVFNQQKSVITSHFQVYQDDEDDKNENFYSNETFEVESNQNNNSSAINSNANKQSRNNDFNLYQREKSFSMNNNKRSDQDVYNQTADFNNLNRSIMAMDTPISQASQHQLTIPSVSQFSDNGSTSQQIIQSYNDSKKIDSTSTQCSSPVSQNKKKRILKNQNLHSQTISKSMINTKPGRAVTARLKDGNNAAIYQQLNFQIQSQLKQNSNLEGRNAFQMPNLSQRTMSDQTSCQSSNMDAANQIKKALSKISQESIFRMNIVQQMSSQASTGNVTMMQEGFPSSQRYGQNQ